MGKDLIAELEAAPEGSRELDRRVLLALGWHIDADGYWWARNGNLGFDGEKETHLLPQPTTSFSAALILVPKRWRWEAADYGGDQDGPRAALWRGIPAEHIDDLQHYGAFGNTPALALCAALCKVEQARQAMEVAFCWRFLRRRVDGR